MENAFVLGAGLGTRLRPLTESLPKPLVPVVNRPLISYAFDHLSTLGIGRFIVNTHHLPNAYTTFFPEQTYQGNTITFRHEPDLLETGGGIANIADLVEGKDLIVYNGDILADFPLAPALAHHQASPYPVTLILRSDHPDKRIAFDSNSQTVTDIRNKLKTGHARDFGFTGIYFLKSEFIRHLPPIARYSVIPEFLKSIQQGTGIGAYVVDEGTWWDLGDRNAYLAAHATRAPTPVIHPEATVDPSAILTGSTCIGQGAVIGADAKLDSTIVWNNATVLPKSSLTRCIVHTATPAIGTAYNRDF